MLPTATHVAVACTHVSHPAKAFRWNEMPFGRDTRAVPSNIVLDRGRAHPTERGRFRDRNPSMQ